VSAERLFELARHLTERDREVALYLCRHRVLTTDQLQLLFFSSRRRCIYTRISTDEENQPTSLHSQRERLEAFSKAQEAWRIVAHQEDRATGTKLERPGLQAALDLARNGRIDLLLVYRVDRLSRKVRQLAQLAEELDTYDVTLRSATEPFDTGSAAGRMMLQMLAVFAEFEHATIVDRVSAGIERRAKEGR
jgi:site-specific DNA recombinase